MLYLRVSIGPVLYGTLLPILFPVVVDRFDPVGFLFLQSHAFPVLIVWFDFAMHSFVSIVWRLRIHVLRGSVCVPGNNHVIRFVMTEHGQWPHCVTPPGCPLVIDSTTAKDQFYEELPVIFCVKGLHHRHFCLSFSFLNFLKLLSTLCSTSSNNRLSNLFKVFVIPNTLSLLVLPPFPNHHHTSSQSTHFLNCRIPSPVTFSSSIQLVGPQAHTLY